MADSGTGEKTEKATGKRRSDARDKGTVPKSAEVSSAAMLLVGFVLLLATSGHFANVLGRNTRYLLGQAHILKPANQFGVREMMQGNMEVLLAALAPVVLGVLVAAVSSNILQFGFKITPKAMQLQVDRLNPIGGMKKFFQVTALFEIGKNLLKITLICLLAYGTVKGLADRLSGAALLPLPAVVALGKLSFMKLMAKLLFFCIVLAVIDWAWQKHRYEENLKMSKYEVKQEHKDYDGDPQIKARVRSLQYEMHRQRMMAAIPSADVVVTNPTHFAVALKYVPGNPAPIVVAKGQDHLAQIIKKIAREAKVPVIENKPLARALYAQVDVGKIIPESLYQAVAEVLAYVYRLKKS
jgi:flagellar biosynthetic protein FlhB